VCTKIKRRGGKTVVRKRRENGESAGQRYKVQDKREEGKEEEKILVWRPMRQRN
jgi:hypothetical protein